MKKRKVKKGKARKQELLDIALELFHKRGYEKTSIEAILKKASISKGAFYYYFNSKDEVLEALAHQQAEEVIKIIQKIADDPRLNALEKLNRVFIEATEYKVVHEESRLKLFKVMERYKKNLKLTHKVLENSVKLLGPSLKKIFEQGIKEGYFDTEFPDEMAEFYLRLANAFQDMFVRPLIELHKKPENIKTIKRKLLFYEDLLARILGLKKGNLLLDESMLKYFKRVYKSKRFSKEFLVDGL